MEKTPLAPISVRDLVAANPDSVNRTPGLHVTDIIAVIMAKLDPKKHARNAEFAEHDLENWQEMGFLWEDLLSRIFAARVYMDGVERFRPGELTCEGIMLSPDGLALDDTQRAGVRLEEYKCTWKSSKDFDLYDRRFLKWLIQIQAYCYATGARVCHLYVLHLNGSYERFIPEVRPWELRFSDREIEDAWMMIRNTARKEGWL